MKCSIKLFRALYSSANFNEFISTPLENRGDPPDTAQDWGHSSVLAQAY